MGKVELDDNYEKPILRKLSEMGGFTTGQIARSFASPFGRTTREHSSDVRAWLVQLKAKGLVSLIDDQKPSCWYRTAMGSKVLFSNGERP